MSPAYVGKSDLYVTNSTFKEDHPRLRGEKKTVTDMGERLSGSPPLTRGKVCYALPDLAQRRITPAYAGKSLRRGLLLARVRDHPRIRGEKPYVHMG